MTISRMSPADRAKLALELTMRDALDGMEELASLEACWFEAGCLEILSIERPAPARPAPSQPCTHHSAKLLTFPEKRCCVG